MTIKKTLLAIAISSAVVAPAALAQSSVQIYGKLYPYLLSEKGSGATAVGSPKATLAATPTGTNGITETTGMVSGNSRIGFRGTEDLGGGLKAIFQMEGTVGVDDGVGNLFSRDTFVGLKGGFGAVKLGSIDTIFKNYGDTVGVLGLGSGTFLSSSSVLRKTGFGTSSASSFHLRRANSVQYESPEFGGFQAGVQYSTDELKTATRNPRQLSMGVKYDQGPWFVAVAHEIHYDQFGGSNNAPSAMRNNGTTDLITNSKDTATQLTVEYRLSKNHKFEFDVIRKDYKENAKIGGRFESYKNTAYLLGMENRWNNDWRTAVQYAKASAGTCTRIGSACVTDGLDGSKVTLGVGYIVSKRTMLFGAAGKLVNGASARYSNTDFGGKPNPGENITHVALGISHSF
ncbi:MAG: porin [Nitrosomonadaceae bacterium]|nr:porin [Nitrosomonadaceae bacterium]